MATKAAGFEGGKGNLAPAQLFRLDGGTPAPKGFPVHTQCRRRGAASAQVLSPSHASGSCTQAAGTGICLRCSPTFIMQRAESMLPTTRHTAVSTHGDMLLLPCSYRGSTGIVCRASDGGASYRKRQEKAAWDEGEEKVDAAADSEKIEIGAAQVAFEESQVGAKGAAEESQGRAKGAAEESQGRAKGAARSTKANVAGAAADAKSAIQSAEDAAGGGSRKSVRGTSKRLQQGVDDAAGAAQGAARRAGAYADDPQRAVDDAADSAQRGIDSAAESLSQGIEQVRMSRALYNRFFFSSLHLSQEGKVA